MRARRGFTLIEVIVAVTIMIMMAAVVLPSLIRGVDRARVDDGVDQLQKLVAAIAAFEGGVGRWPGAISQLSQPISTGMDNICGANFNNGQVNQWDNSGPFFDRLAPATGLPISIGTAQDAFQQTDVSGNSSLLNIVVSNVSLADALEVNERIDADNSATLGSIRWTTTAVPDVVEMRYMMPINGC